MSDRFSFGMIMGEWFVPSSASRAGCEGATGALCLVFGFVSAVRGISVPFELPKFEILGYCVAECSDGNLGSEHRVCWASVHVDMDLHYLVMGVIASGAGN